MTRDQLIAAWVAADAALKAAQKAEMNARRLAFMACWPVDNEGKQTIEYGTNYIDLGRGYRFQSVTGLNYNLPNKDDKVDAIAQHLGGEIADTVFKWKPELKVKGYRELSIEHRKMVDTVLVTSPKTPSLKLLAPGDK